MKRQPVPVSDVSHMHRVMELAKLLPVEQHLAIIAWRNDEVPWAEIRARLEAGERR